MQMFQDPYQDDIHKGGEGTSIVKNALLAQNELLFRSWANRRGRLDSDLMHHIVQVL